MSPQTELVTAIREGNRPLVEAISSLKSIIEATGINGRTVETRMLPAWTAKEATAECDYTGATYPPDKGVELDDFTLHPGVAEWMKSNGHSPASFEGDVPEEATKIPLTEQVVSAPIQKAARKTTERPTWSVEELPELSRPALMAAAKDVGLNARCKEIGIDYRRESKEWIAKAVDKIVKHPKGKLPKPESEANLKAMAALEKEKAKAKKKTSKKKSSSSKKGKSKKKGKTK